MDETTCCASRRRPGTAPRSPPTAGAARATRERSWWWPTAWASTPGGTAASPRRSSTPATWWSAPPIATRSRAHRRVAPTPTETSERRAGTPSSAISAPSCASLTPSILPSRWWPSVTAWARSLLQQYLLDHSADVEAAVLSGTTALDVVAPAIDPTKEVDLTAFNPASHRRAPATTGSAATTPRSTRYVDDPLCGFGLDPAATAGFSVPPDLAPPTRGGSAPTCRSTWCLGSPTRSPAVDRSSTCSADRYRDAGLRDVTVVLYPPAPPRDPKRDQSRRGHRRPAGLARRSPQPDWPRRHPSAGGTPVAAFDTLTRSNTPMKRWRRVTGGP